MIVKIEREMYIAARFNFLESGVTEYRGMEGWTVNPERAFLFEAANKAGVHAVQVTVTTYLEIP